MQTKVCFRVMYICNAFLAYKRVFFHVVYDYVPPVGKSTCLCGVLPIMKRGTYVETTAVTANLDQRVHIVSLSLE